MKDKIMNLLKRVDAVTVIQKKFRKKKRDDEELKELDEMLKEDEIRKEEEAKKRLEEELAAKRRARIIARKKRVEESKKRLKGKKEKRMKVKKTKKMQKRLKKNQIVFNAEREKKKILLALKKPNNIKLISRTTSTQWRESLDNWVRLLLTRPVGNMVEDPEKDKRISAVKRVRSMVNKTDKKKANMLFSNLRKQVNLIRLNSVTTGGYKLKKRSLKKDKKVVYMKDKTRRKGKRGYGGKSPKRLNKNKYVLTYIRSLTRRRRKYN